MKRRGPPIILLKLDGTKATREASFYVQLSCHPHIVRTFGLIPSPMSCVQLIQERAPHPDLCELLQEKLFQPSEQVLLRIFEQISDAMICLTDNGIIHGDLACRNILVFEYHSEQPERNLVKLTDFGLTKNSSIYSLIDNSSRSTLNIVPTRYVAPEVLQNNQRTSYSEKSDVYSMSVLAWEALSGGQIPYSSLHDEQQVKETILRGERLSRPAKCSEELWTLISECWHLDPRDRPHFRSLKQSFVQFQFQVSSNSIPAANPSTSKSNQSHSPPRRRTENQLDRKDDTLTIVICPFCSQRCLKEDQQTHRVNISRMMNRHSFIHSRRIVCQSHVNERMKLFAFLVNIVKNRSISHIGQFTQ